MKCIRGLTCLSVLLLFPFFSLETCDKELKQCTPTVAVEDNAVPCEIATAVETIPEYISVSPLEPELEQVLFEACEKASVSFCVGLALIETESAFNADAVNARSGCYGLCQLNPRYFASNLSPAENIQAGIEYLGALLKKYGDISAALTAYNAGHDTGNRSYATAVLTVAEKWEALNGTVK